MREKQKHSLGLGLLLISVAAFVYQPALGHAGFFDPVTKPVVRFFFPDKNATKYIIKELRSRGIKIVEQGEYVTLVIPADKLFPTRSPRLQRKAHTTLVWVGRYLEKLKKVSVGVAGFTDNEGVDNRNFALSQQRADAVADYLWSQKIDARMTYSTGFGPTQPIATNQTSKGRHLNRRIEIHVRRFA